MSRWLVNAVVVLSTLLLGVGVLTILPPQSSRPGAYLADRNLGLTVLLLVLLFIGWHRNLAAVLLTTAALHLVDGAADVRFGNWPAAAGSLVVAGVSILVAAWLFKQLRPVRRT